jgi:hypothetical protein
MTWIPISQKPKAFTDVLLTDGKSIWVGHILENVDVFFASHPDYKREYWDSDFPAMPFLTRCVPTHWMSLPAPPEVL